MSHASGVPAKANASSRAKPSVLFVQSVSSFASSRTVFLRHVVADIKIPVTRKDNMIATRSIDSIRAWVRGGNSRASDSARTTLVDL